VNASEIVPMRNDMYEEEGLTKTAIACLTVLVGLGIVMIVGFFFIN